MLITYEVLNEDTLPILEQLERLHLLRRVPEMAPKNDAVKPVSMVEQLNAWANESHLIPSQKAARIQLIPQLLEHYQISIANPEQSSDNPASNALHQRKAELAEIIQAQRAEQAGIKRKWAGMISPETGKKMLQHVEEMRNEWERNF